MPGRKAGSAAPGEGPRPSERQRRRPGTALRGGDPGAGGGWGERWGRGGGCLPGHTPFLPGLCQLLSETSGKSLRFPQPQFPYLCSGHRSRVRGTKLLVTGKVAAARGSAVTGAGSAARGSSTGLRPAPRGRCHHSGLGLRPRGPRHRHASGLCPPSARPAPPPPASSARRLTRVVHHTGLAALREGAP